LTEPRLYTQLQRQTLPNGMRVWCLPRPETRTVALLMHLPVGARTETKENNGISHFLEHMLFTGTERWTEAEISDVIRRRGAQYNGQTSREETMYYLHINAEDAAFGMDWLHQILFKPTLTEDKFEKEREVIINEKGGEFDRLQKTWEWIEDHNLGWSVVRAVRTRIYPDSPMLLPVIGRDKTLKSITRQQLVDYYHTHYVPQNMTMVVVGDIEPAQAFELAEAQFGSIPSQASSNPHPTFKVVDKPFEVNLQGPMPTDQCQYLVGTVLDSGSHPDRFGWWVIEEMLDNAYMQDLRYQLGLTYSINVYVSLYTDTGYMGIYSRAKEKDMPTIVKSIQHHLDRLVRGEFSETELSEAKVAIRGRNLLDLQDNLEMATWLAYDALHTRGENILLDDYFESIAAVTAEDVQRIARQYLAPQKRFVVEHTPILTPKRMRPLLIGALGTTTALLSLRQATKGGRD
jgi:predicted Zn-dependent peptidase